jgi:glycosyltransferase involved in cell wall biosynthesis
MPAVTIGLPFYNCASTLRFAIESIKQQTFKDWELIIIDDGSTNGTFQLLSNEWDERIRMVRYNDNRGLAFRLNEITRLARGNFIARMDADDLMHPRRIERQMEMLRVTGASIVTTEAFVIDSNNKVLGQRRPSRTYQTPQQVLRHNGPIHPTMMACREFFVRCPYLCEPRRAEDLAMWTTALKTEKVVTLPDRLHFYREDTAFDFPKYRRTMAAHRQIFRQFAPEHGGLPLLVELYCRSYIKEYSYCIAELIGARESIAARRRLIPLELSEEADAQMIVDAISMAVATDQLQESSHAVAKDRGYDD